MKPSKKLQHTRGETLTETLCALLAVVLSSLLLAVFISAAARMNSDAQKRDHILYDALSQAERQEVPGQPGEVTVLVNGRSCSFSVSYFGGETFTSYRPEGGGTK